MLVAVSMTKVVVVGTGSMGYNHARVCSELGILAGVMDQDTSSAKRVGELFDVPYYSDFEPGLTPGAEEGGAPLLFLGERTCVVTGFNTVVFASTDSSFLIGFSTAIF